MFKSTHVLRDALQVAIHQTAANYRNEESRGAVGIARRLGLNEGTFSNKCVARPGDHQITLFEAVLMMRETNDFRILRAVCSMVDHIAYPQPDFDQCSDIELLNLWADQIEKQGKYATTVKVALDDGVITEEEVAQCHATLQVAMSAGLAFVARLNGLVKREP